MNRPKPNPLMLRLMVALPLACVLLTSSALAAVTAHRPGPRISKQRRPPQPDPNANPQPGDAPPPGSIPPVEGSFVLTFGDANPLNGAMNLDGAQARTGKWEPTANPKVVGFSGFRRYPGFQRVSVAPAPRPARAAFLVTFDDEMGLLAEGVYTLRFR